MSLHLHQSPLSGEIELSHCLIKDLGALYESGEYSDVTLIIAGDRINSHKVILAARSQYFRALLYGGLKESSQHEIELKGTTVLAFRGLLKFIYTGHISLADQHEKVIMDILGSAHQYGFIDVETAIVDYLGKILDIKNVCLIFDAARLYQFDFLTKLCREYIDKHTLVVMRDKTFLRLSLSSLNDLIARDSFYAPEIDVFLAVQAWLKANPDEAAKDVVGQVRLELVDMKDLLRIVGPSGLVPFEAISNAFDVQMEADDSQLAHRSRLVPEENVANTKLGAQVLQGESPESLLDGNTQNYDGDQGYTWHTITDSRENGILVKLGTRCTINHVKMLLWDLDSRSYSYYLEVSVNQKTWVRVVDHTKYFCRSWQYLYFDARVVTYIRIVGTHNTVNTVFHVVSFEACLTNQPVKLCNGFVVPTENVATPDRSASIVAGVSRPHNALLDGDTSTYNWERGYTCHEIGADSIIVQLGQPYMIDSMRLLLWDCDKRSCSYSIEVSINSRDWIIVANETAEACRSWQTLCFQPPRPVVFIRIKGTGNTANGSFRRVHFECPAQTEA